LPTLSAVALAGVVTIILLRPSAHAAVQQAPLPPTLPDVQKLGPPVGSRVPDFTLLDQKGQPRVREGCAAAFVARPGKVLYPLGPKPDITGPDFRNVAKQIVTVETR
jgi:hypothetical protein